MTNQTSIPETGITFFRSGGHKHDGVGSSLIDYTQYSIFDFAPDISTSNRDVAREQIRSHNQSRFNTYLSNFISTQVLAPAGIELAENSVRGIHIGASEITSENILANTITAQNIAANTITSDELVTNFVLVNNTISSNNYSTGVSGWTIANSGSAEFNNVTVRGTVEATAGNVGGWTINTSNITSGTNSVVLNSNGTIVGAAIIGGSLTSNTNTSGDRTVISSNQLNFYNVSAQGVAKITFNNSSTSWLGVIEGINTGVSILANGQTGNAQLVVGAAAGFPEYQWWGYGSTIAILAKNGSGGTTTFSISGGDFSGQKVQLSGSGNGYYLYDRTLTTINWATYVNNGFYRIYNPLGDAFAISANDWYVYNLQNDPGGTVNLKYLGNGQISKAVSKREFKTNINYEIEGLSIINKLKPASFDWKQSFVKNYGFIAEDVADVDKTISVYEPQIVDNMTNEEKKFAFENKESWIPSYYSETGILALAVKSIQELDAKIKDLEAKLGYTK